jgi:hypothetical protein
MNPTYAASRAGIKGAVVVYLERRRIGTILPVKGGFQYAPINSKERGEVFLTVEGCKLSLELSED